MRKRSIDPLLSPAERRVFQKLSSPKKIQDFLDTLPVHFPAVGQGLYSPRFVLQYKKAHCIEGAVLAAVALAYHGRSPLLLDLQSTEDDKDHVVTLYKSGRYWGAISKTNHPVLRWRDPIYKTVRELALSYFHEYFLWHQGRAKGKKTLRAYSKPFNLDSFAPERWVVAETIDWLAEELDASPHLPFVPKGTTLRPASTIECVAMDLTEWSKKGKRLL